MAIFSNFFFVGNITQENVSFDILERKNAFLCYKARSSKSREIDIFPKWLTHAFCPKMAIFSNFFFVGNISQQNVFYDMLEQKKAFLGYKNKTFKKSKNGHSLKGVNPWFWSKNGHFYQFFFSQYSPAKCLLRHSRTKKRLSRL